MEFSYLTFGDTKDWKTLTKDFGQYGTFKRWMCTRYMFYSGRCFIQIPFCYVVLWLFLSHRDIPRIPESSHPPLESSKNSLKFYLDVLYIFPSNLLVVNYTWLTLCQTAGSSSFESQKMDRPSISVMSPTSPGALRDLPLVLPGQLSVSATLARNQPCGSIWDGYMDADSPPPTWCLQVKLWYDKVGHQLNVNVLQAIDLPTRPDGRPRNPYVKMYFLPDRRYLLSEGRKLCQHFFMHLNMHGLWWNFA